MIYFKKDQYQELQSGNTYVDCNLMWNISFIRLGLFFWIEEVKKRETNILFPKESG